MGLQQSKPLDRKPSRSKSSLGEKQLNSQEILQFASQLNHLVSLNMDNQTDRYDYLVFKKIPFSGKFAPLTMCQRASFNYDSVFICYDCSNDPHAYLCQQCFQKGKHEGHRFSVFPNNAGWSQIYCRCGDYEYMKKGTICEEHKQVKIMPTVFVDPKDKKLFSLYFDEIFKTLFSLLDKQRGATNLLNAFFMYLQKATQNNLLFSKTFCEFLLQKKSSSQHTNLFQLISRAYISNTNFFRNISFATEYKIDVLREILLALNEQHKNVKTMSEVILNMDGKMQLLQTLAKSQKLILGLNPLKVSQKQYKLFYDKLIQNDFPANQIWKSIIENKLVKHYINHENVISKIIQFLYEQQKDKELKIKFLQQLLECQVYQSHKQVISMLMILWPEWFLPTSGKSNKVPIMDKNLESMFTNFYQKIFLQISTNSNYEESYETLLLLLPFFSFGQQFINKIWQEIQRRINILQKSKSKAEIRNGSMIFFTFLTKLLRNFFAWQHQTIETASSNGLKSYSHDNKKLIERLLKEQFAKKRKIFRIDMLKIVDEYTQKQRNLATEVIKKFLRYNTKKGKYYYVGDRLGNNMCNYEQLQVGASIKLSEWQQIVVNKIFTEKVYSILPKLIKNSKRGLMQDMQMVKTVSNISIGLSLLNKKQKLQLKQSTRNFIKQISDVSQDVYYVLAAIRDRFQLDMDDLEEEGQRGRKKQKLDLITEIRDKKYRQMKQRQDKILKQWLKHADEADNLLEEDTKEQNFCHICKEKPSQTNRLVYLCNFTRNNVVSTLLKSEVTDLDMNICLHKVHEQCYDKVMNKRHCPLCKFEVNCYIPEKPLNDESYTKNWLRNFENIVTRINLQSGKSFSSDWATIFLTYLVFSRSFRVLLKNTEIQQKQLETIDKLLMLHYKNQLSKWPQLAKQAIKRAQKTVKGQVARQSNIKKNVKSLTLDLVLQQITQQPFKNEKRIEKKIRQLINFVGHVNAEKIAQGFEYCRENEAIKEILSQSISQENQETTQLFKLKQLPQTAKEYLQKTTILCPMCNKYQSTTWQCLFCDKVSCGSCINDYSHVDRDHRGSSIILYLNDAEYKLVHQNREVQRDSLYRNQYEQGWKRNNKPQGWKCCTKEMQQFFENILHSKSIKKITSADDNSDDGRGGTLFGNNRAIFGGNNGGWNQRGMEQNQDDDQDNQDYRNHDQDEEQQEQEE